MTNFARTLALLLASCWSGAPPAARPDPHPVAPPTGEHAVTYDSLDEALSLSSPHPPDRLLGVAIGDAPPYARIRANITDFGTATATLAFGPDGKVRRVAVALSETPATDGLANLGLAIRWEEAPGWHDQRRFLGAHSQTFIRVCGGFLSGIPVGYVALHPLDDTVPCAPRDDFGAFRARFERAVDTADAAAVAAMFVPGTSDMLTCRAKDGDTRPTDLACLRRILDEIRTSGAVPTCTFGEPSYLWKTAQELHGGTYFAFVRDATGWHVSGPRYIGHDDNPGGC